jgi:hypothetical protein
MGNGGVIRATISAFRRSSLAVTTMLVNRQLGSAMKGTADDDRDHIKRLRLPVACPVPGDEGFSAE